MLETPEARACLRRRLELCASWEKSPVSINMGLKLLDMVERQEKMIDWLADRLPKSMWKNEHGVFVEIEGINYWREFARQAVEGK